jgi:hypothetical protein
MSNWWIISLNQVARWCKRAAWSILAFNLVRLLLLLIAIGTGHISLPSSLLWWWNSLLQNCLGIGSEALFNFFVLYATAVLVEYLAAAAAAEKKLQQQNNVND